VERVAEAEAVLLATFETAVGAGVEDVPRPADTDFAGAPGLATPVALDEWVAVELGGGVAVGLFNDVGLAVVLGGAG